MAVVAPDRPTAPRSARRSAALRLAALGFALRLVSRLARLGAPSRLVSPRLAWLGAPPRRASRLHGYTARAVAFGPPTALAAAACASPPRRRSASSRLAWLGDPPGRASPRPAAPRLSWCSASPRLAVARLHSASRCLRTSRSACRGSARIARPLGRVPDHRRAALLRRHAPVPQTPISIAFSSAGGLASARGGGKPRSDR